MEDSKMRIEKLLFQEDDQFIYWDGDEIVIFDMLAYQPLDNEVQFVVTKSGKISYQTFNIFVAYSFNTNLPSSGS